MNSEQVVFHGGCIGCTQQEIHKTTDFWYDCRYFEADWSKPSLNNAPPNATELERRRVRLVRKVGAYVIVNAPKKRRGLFSRVFNRS